MNGTQKKKCKRIVKNDVVMLTCSIQGGRDQNRKKEKKQTKKQTSKKPTEKYERKKKTKQK